MLAYTLVVLYCTSQTECWKLIPFPDESFATAALCRKALESRAGALLAPHFAKDEINIGLICERAGAATEAAAIMDEGDAAPDTDPPVRSPGSVAATAKEGR